ncbi:hypothetical protein [Microbulbifer thermotolerans]|uniref:hypothetical protein n=1 Tax=Microbulbifer thermotolerans TaxID=252514 RepID=UPI002248C655|nr:hypothetical protein [Microbulbifer thermotolerans]MCX2832316.1 hypothetical protein [Microbulbifer thermotolerans]MCX2842061.1 hypothetical protein [Microbulbifer thermotolerans]
MKKIFPLLAALLHLSTPAAADEVIELESSVIGSQEQPKVLYIIPWKQADSLQRLDSVLPQTVGYVFSHQEYSELQREMKLLQNDQEKQKNP